MNIKLNRVLNKLEKIESRLGLIEKNLDKNTKKTNSIDSRCDEIENVMQNTVTLTNFEALKERLSNWKSL